jgi:hypothetical protein
MGDPQRERGRSVAVAHAGAEEKNGTAQRYARCCFSEVHV